MQAIYYGEKVMPKHKLMKKQTHVSKFFDKGNKPPKFKTTQRKSLVWQKKTGVKL